MGACFSSKQSKPKVTSKTIRVVHMDGTLEDYEDLTTVDQVINNFPMHFLCTPIQILQNGLLPLKPDHQLKTGKIYFVFPNSTLRFNATPDDLTSLTKKLTNIAKTGKCLAKSVPISPSASALCSPQATTKNHFFDRKLSDYEEARLLNSPKLPLWKPILDTIMEGK
ncbi:uncharacterized protein [Rutidosis leptorrhynchoides]|uniref:uncharacterized protein n=1 Tax=Rutidosis leptorrhynchoides TaxID=125765 RepID=UPI003A997F2D